MRGRFNPVAITGDLQKAFLQVKVKETDRDAMRFHWRRDEQSPLEALRFTRAIFGLASSPFLLGGVIEMHLNHWEKKERDLAKLWVEWESRLPESFTIQRSLVVHREEIEQLDLHSFGDACANGVAACVYAVIRQASGTNQGLIAARSRLAKQGLTILRLELVALVTWL